MAVTNSTRAMAAEPAFYKPRTFMISDILNEPDDEMSLVRFLLYSNQFDVRGLCASTSISLQNETHPEAMERIIRAYGKVVDNLNFHVGPNCQFPSADKLLALVSSGPKVYGRKFLSEPLSEGARRLVQSLEECEEPLYVGLWGGANVVAQALHHIDQTKPKAEANQLRSRLRVYSISDQDDTGPWIRQRWPTVVYIVSMHGFGEFLAATWVGINAEDNGVPDMTKVQDDWLTPNIRVGPLGAEYPLIKFGMEGDSPSFMGLISNGLSNPEKPEWGGWGGRYNRITWAHDLSAEYGVSPDTVVAPGGKPYMSVQSTVWRWRDASQDDFAARMQWTLHQDFSAATHPPLVDVNGSVGPEALHIMVPPNASITLDASKTVDLDHPGDIGQLEFEWFYYLEPGFPQATADKKMAEYMSLEPLSPPGGTDGRLSRNQSGFGKVILGPEVSVTNLVPDERDLRSREWHIILQVKTKKGPYPVTRYKRVVLKSE
ncbi:hypothetical protein CDV36_013438 [Fusarium kuroshium]|uniref:Uncharacterized protein n=1 Tax=Fusarium kuroshium TaxID=2010991 RepID=A0A3M2RNR5_9HYPO|nr:hypothetical protein CDV36_013438 [Fusarium kuroshium]